MPEDKDEVFEKKEADGNDVQTSVDRRSFTKTLTGIAAGLATVAAVAPTAKASLSARSKILDRIQRDLNTGHPSPFTDGYDKGNTGDHYSKT